MAMDMPTQPPALYAHAQHNAAEDRLAADRPSFSWSLLAQDRGDETRIDRSKYHFNHPWFETVRTGSEEITAPLVGKRLDILEVGSFEGGSITWILDPLMDHEGSTLTSVDTFGGSPEHATPGFRLHNLEEIFWNNVKQAKSVEKLRQLKGWSYDRLYSCAPKGRSMILST